MTRVGRWVHELAQGYSNCTAFRFFGSYGLKGKRQSVLGRLSDCLGGPRLQRHVALVALSVGQLFM